jgi:WD40 repeat protein/tetratricopeptide (TPR) repeat protein
VAGLLGIDFDELRQRERARRRRNIAIAAITALVMVLAGIGVIFKFQRVSVEANDSHREATRNSALILIRDAERAISDGDMPLARTLALAAIDTPTTRPDSLEYSGAATILGRIFDLNLLAAIPSFPFFKAAYSPDGSRIVTYDGDGKLELWDTTTFRLVKAITVMPSDADQIRAGTLNSDDSDADWPDDNAVIRGDDTVRSATFDPTGSKLFVTSARGRITVWDVLSGKFLEALGFDGGEISSLAFSKDGSRLLYAGKSGSATIWDIAKDNRVRTITGLNPANPLAAFIGDQHTIMVLSQEGPVLFIDIDHGRTIRRFGDKKTWDASISADGLLVALTELGGGLQEYTARDGKHSFQISNIDISHAVFSPSQPILATTPSDENIIRIWDNATGAQKYTLSGHTAPIVDLAFSADGTVIATISADKSVRVWEADTGKQLEMFSTSLETAIASQGSVAFSPNGSQILASYGAETRIWRRSNTQSHDSEILHTRFALVGDQSSTRAPVSLVGAPGHEALLQAENFQLTQTKAPSITPAALSDFLDFVRLIETDPVDFSERTRLGLVPENAAKVKAGGKPVRPCDQMAGDEYDQDRRASIPAYKINAKTAIPECEKALKAEPNDPALHYEYGRALAVAERTHEAVQQVQMAASQNYPAALYTVAFDYESGNLAPDIPKNEARAMEYFRKAATAGMLLASSEIAERLWEGSLVRQDRDAAITMWQEAAAKGDPFSHDKLAGLYESGDGLPQDLEQALFHRILAARMFDEAGQTAEAVSAARARARLARGMPDPSVAVRIWRAAMASSVH